MQYVTKVTSELREGDIVNCHGMRCLIDREIKVSRSHPRENGDVLYTKALVLNRDDVPGAVVPVSWTADWDPARRFNEAPHDGEHRWSIQGNDLARWSVEVKGSA